MRLKEITEAAQSVTIQGRHPISAGARGLMAARWKYDKIVDAAAPNNTKNAVSKLASNLDGIEKTDYATINGLMQEISHQFVIDPKQLHDAFIKKYNLTPDAFAVKLKHDRNNRPKSI
jgi:hypothetical protein